MEELYGALNNDLHMLAAIGIRTSFDIAAELLGIDPEQTFQKKLKELVAKGLIAALDEARLEVLVEAGNASAHRGWRPSSGDLNTMMDVLEHFVREAFVVPEQKKELNAEVAKVKTTVPGRAARRRGGG